jgi:ankyrin repeat protein
MAVVEGLSGEEVSSQVGQVSEQSPEQSSDQSQAATDLASLAPDLEAEDWDGDDDDEDYEDYSDEDYDDEDDDEDYEADEFATTPLGAAILGGDLNTVTTLLEAGADPNPAAWYQTPALVVAAHRGQVEITQALIAAGANVNRGFDQLPLHTAAQAGHLEVVRLLLEAGADVEGYEEDYWTALMAASSAGHRAIVELLVQRGADVNAWSQGETPLMLAARGVHREIYQFLYPLVSAEIGGIGDRDAEQEMARTLKERSRKQNKAVETLIDAAMDGNLAQVQQLITNGAQVNAIASCNRTPLSLAIQGGHIPIIQALLDAGADPNLADEDDDGRAANSPLMEAASTFFATNRSAMVRLLIERGADLNQQDAEGQTPLMHALSYGDLDVIQALIEAGADLDIPDHEGNTALVRARYGDLTQATTLLLQAGACEQGLKEVELLEAVEQGNLDQVRVLLAGNLNVNRRVGGSTALCRAACKGYDEIAKLLIGAGADVDRRADEGYFNPLLYGAYGGNLAVVKVLLEAGANVQVRVTDYLNPLEYAELGKREGNNQGQPYDQVIALLERYGATRSDRWSAQ